MISNMEYGEKKIIRIGSRASKLAIAQTEIVACMIRKAHPELTVEIVTMQTMGDKILSKSLEAIGGKGLFIQELNQALEDDQIDLAVHSLKDMPMDQELSFPILAYSKREDPRDVLVLREGLRELPEKPLIGTSSKRRKIQLEKLYEDASFCLIRGNVQTRIRKLSKEQMDATILAAAGLKRVQMEGVIAKYFSVDEMIPSAGQGILALQGKDTPFHRELASCVQDEEAMAEAIAERAFVRELNGGCTSPVAAHASIVCADRSKKLQGDVTRTAKQLKEDTASNAKQNEEQKAVKQEKILKLRGLYYREDGTWFVETCQGNVQDADIIGVTLAKRMRMQASL